MLPVLYRAGEVALRVLPSAGQATLAQRLGTTVANLANYIRGNKVATAMTVASAYQFLDGDSIAEIASDPELMKFVEQFKHLAIDDAKEVTGFAAEIVDEYAAITAAVNRFGGLENYLQIRKGLLVSEETIKSYLTNRERARMSGF